MFFGRSLTIDEKVQIVSEHRSEHGLNRCLEAIGLAKSTWYYRQHEYQSRRPAEERLKEIILDIIGDHPDYGWRRILPELRERTGERINHKRLKRLLREYELGLARQLPRRKPSPLRTIVREAEPSSRLIS